LRKNIGHPPEFPESAYRFATKQPERHLLKMKHGDIFPSSRGIAILFRHPPERERIAVCSMLATGQRMRQSIYGINPWNNDPVQQREGATH
jgi:hypothetical protein